ncbi:MAG: hypothetical protein WDM76_11330 [Limisphaerales bacterium]
MARPPAPDAWWLQPLLVFLGFFAFIVYSTWAAFQGLNDMKTGVPSYWYGGNGANYLSPFYSPEFWGVSPARHWKITGLVAGLGAILTGVLILWIPAGFRFTCYYYRGAYYKAFWATRSIAPSVSRAKKYLGERYFPLIIQNIHRYFFYLAALFIILLSHDAWKGMWFDDGKHFGIGVGTIVLTLNAIFLAMYTFGCHSLRHLIGGFLDSKSKAPTCAKAYNCVSCLNTRHMMWAWISLFWVGFTDVYVRLCATGHLSDIVFFKL